MKMYPEANELDHILMLRIDAPLFFANVESVKNAIRKFENAYEKRGRSYDFIIVDLSPVTDIDASAVHFLKVLPSFRQLQPCSKRAEERLMLLELAARVCSST